MGKVYYYYCYNCGEEYIVSCRKNKLFDGKRCDKCGQGSVVPKIYNTPRSEKPISL